MWTPRESRFPGQGCGVTFSPLQKRRPHPSGAVFYLRPLFAPLRNIVAVDDFLRVFVAFRKFAAPFVVSGLGVPIPDCQAMRLKVSV